MKAKYIILPLLCICMTAAAQDSIDTHHHDEDSTDVFFLHLNLNEVTVTGVTGDVKLKHSTTPVSVVRPQELRATAASNVIDAISHQPGISQLTTGSSISKPIIRGLGYNRVVVISEGVRQEGQQWGDEHGVEVDGNAVNSVEILKGPTSLMYGSDAMAGVVILHSQPTLAEGELHGNAVAEHQTNNGLFGYSLSMEGNKKGLVWSARYSDKAAHAYRNRFDGYVPGSQFRENAAKIMTGISRYWGSSHVTWTAYRLTPGIIEGERDPETGQLEHEEEWTGRHYSATLPFQKVRHHKLVWDNSLNLSLGCLKALVGYQQNRRQEFEESIEECGLSFRLHTLTYDLRYISNELNGWKLAVGMGGMLQQSANMGEEFLIPDYHLFDAGLFATASKTFAERWTVNGGIRYDYRQLQGDELEDDGKQRFANFSRQFYAPTGSVGAVYNVNDHFNVRFNVARGFRTPNISELASNGVHEGSVRYELGDSQLKSEYSLQADFGIDLTSRYLSAQVALFANRIDNYIFTHRLPYEIESGYLTYAYTQGDARLMGFEAGFDFHPVHSLHLANTFSYVDARLLRQPDETKFLPFTPAPRLNSELKWELMHHSHSTVTPHSTHEYWHTHTRRGLSLNNVVLTAGIEHYLKQNHVYLADDTETPTPSYTLLNVSGATDLQFNGRKVAELYVIASNLLDCAYQNHLSRLKYADIDCLTGRRGVYNMGRNITFKLVMSIGEE